MAEKLQKYKTVELPGAELLLKCLEDQNVEVIFGYPGALFCQFTTLYLRTIELNIF